MSLRGRNGMGRNRRQPFAMSGEWFQLAFLVIALAIVWASTLFRQTAHIVVGNTHIFRYNWVPWIFLAVNVVMLLAFAGFARRVLESRWGALIFLLAIPVFGFIQLQVVFERVELSKDLLVHRREPPFTEFDVDIPWKEISKVTRIQNEKPGFFAPDYFLIGYTCTLDDGRTIELPSGTVLTRASPWVDRELRARGIPIKTVTIPMPR